MRLPSDKYSTAFQIPFINVTSTLLYCLNVVKSRDGFGLGLGKHLTGFHRYSISGDTRRGSLV